MPAQVITSAYVGLQKLQNLLKEKFGTETPISVTVRDDYIIIHLPDGDQELTQAEDGRALGSGLLYFVRTDAAELESLKPAWYPGAIHTPTRAIYVVKQPLSTKEFEAEKLMLSLCNQRRNQNIITLLAAFSYDGLDYIILPAASSDLAALWRQSGPGTLSLPRACVIDSWVLLQLIGLSDALSTIHSDLRTADNILLLGIHGDVKASNILFYATGEWANPGILQLADFGSSKIFQDAAQTPEASSLHGVLGTYAAPESVLEGASTQAIDIWSLGCIILEFVVWFREGIAGLDTFPDARLRQSYAYQLNINGDFFFQLEPEKASGMHRKPWVERVNPGVVGRIETLNADDSIGAIMRGLLAVTQHDILVIDPSKRIDAASLCQKLKALFDTSVTRHQEDNKTERSEAQ